METNELQGEAGNEQWVRWLTTSSVPTVVSRRCGARIYVVQHYQILWHSGSNATETSLYTEMNGPQRLLTVVDSMGCSVKTKSFPEPVRGRSQIISSKLRPEAALRNLLVLECRMPGRL